MKYDIPTFVDSLIEAKGLSYLNDNVLVEMRKDLTTRIENRINAIIASNIPEGVHAEFEKLVSSKASDEEVQKFCLEKVPNLQSLVAADMAEFQSVYLGK